MTWHTNCSYVCLGFCTDACLAVLERVCRRARVSFTLGLEGDWIDTCRFVLLQFLPLSVHMGSLCNLNGLTFGKQKIHLWTVSDFDACLREELSLCASVSFWRARIRHAIYPDGIFTNAFDTKALALLIPVDLCVFFAASRSE